MNWTVFPAQDSYNEASDYGVVELFINCQQRPVVYGDSAASAVPTWNVMFHCSSYTPAVACIYNWHRNTIVIRQTLSCKWKCRAERFLVYSDSIRCKVLLPLCSKWFGCNAVQRAVAVTVPFHNGSESRPCSASADCYRVFGLIKRLNRTSDWIGFIRIQ